ncbi:hypothetical protein AAA799B03_01377 [Marine Group I thaumarchaeote SCGC AAA799-B03]|uniref:Uncharacterized protein n=1 Tax=Marine Group I thaumarchaeote SCGC AAA799-B03 TaxID=1502289 RepID=A0A087S5U7_9ARCH|nr:hypothetical protein AAA799B03_01377 [Marine Group I thaumarchaeote SCGC AAA799-B03]
MQKPTLSIKDKTKILVTVSVAALVISVPLGFERIDFEVRGYYAIHIVSVIFGLVLSIIGIITYFEFRKTRLLMVFAAFLTITIAESTSLVNLINPIFDIVYGTHDLIIHGLVLVMLSFFVVGIFRTD